MSIDITYCSYNQKRADEKWKKFPQDIAALRKAEFDGNKDIVLTAEQEALRKYCDLSNLIYSDQVDDTFSFEMANIDLYFGGIANDYFEDNRVAATVMEDLLVPTFNLSHEGNAPSGKALVGLYGDNLKENVVKLSKVIATEFGWDEEIGMTYALDFFRSMKPVAKDLKEHSDSILVLTFGGDNVFKPASAHTILMERAQKHIQVYK